MKLNKSKILVGSLVAAATIAVTIPFVIPKHKKSDRKIIEEAQNNFQKSLNQTTLQATDFALQKFFGLKLKTILEVSHLTNNDKVKYDFVNHLGAYIFKHHDQSINLYLDAWNPSFKTRNFLIVFNKVKTKSKVNDKQKFIKQYFDPQKDLFAMQGILFDNQIIGSQILYGLEKPSLKKISGFNTKTYWIINLLKVFNNQKQLNAKILLNKNQYNMAFDSNSRVLEFIKVYLNGLLKDKFLKIRDLDLYVSFIKKGSNHVDKNYGTGIIVLKYQNIVIQKTITDFQYQQGYLISINPGKKYLVADDVTKNFIDFSKLPANVTVTKVIPDPSRHDGTTIKVVYQGGKIKEQQLSGFSSYETKALEILNALQVKDFHKQEINKALLAKQDLKTLVISAIRVNGYGKTPIKEMLKALITKVEYQQDSKILSLTIWFNEKQKVFTFKF